ncbi:hypothetical protein C5167_009568 [Papaver somniferum]|uniref:Uncharacterized protein n=1 Tax=Papaver somniferum TaxID=3469 RepID=A0A4Y7JYW8_PAPSO|nr:hypothetical protein C5167_009568 [Papaver somniferum]
MYCTSSTDIKKYIMKLKRI